MNDFERLVVAIKELIGLRQERLDALLEPVKEPEAELFYVEAQLAELQRDSAEDQMAAGQAFAELVTLFGSVEEVWAQYPSAAGLVLFLRTPKAREGMLVTARMVTKA